MDAKILFKYRPINTIEQLIRVLDSIKNCRIFFPTYKQLNDPLESSGYVIELTGYAGKGATFLSDEEDRFVQVKRQEYRILALTENCFSPSMWAHYASDYKGICIGYWKNEVFSLARQLKYIREPHVAKSSNEMGLFDFDDVEFDKAVYESFFYKHADWDYEKEWRIVSKQKDNFLEYNSSNLACIIFGNNLNEEIRNFLISNINFKVPMYYSKPGYRSFRINLLPLDYKLDGFGGGMPPFIRDVDTLIEDIKANT
ncbi:MAG: DUF2971 domain-containing protein [Oscillospiraceae bacterium]|nr:DUF2971 domain-containing protein [Oscillospiraceae bacterium]